MEERIHQKLRILWGIGRKVFTFQRKLLEHGEDGVPVNRLG